MRSFLTSFVLVLCLVGTVSAQHRALNLKHIPEGKVLVVAHRGDWRNAPENSLQAIQNCIDMGVDMVEIDVQMTSDGEVVLMHDSSLDRTTTGSGRVKDWTLDSLRTLFLRDGLGVATYQHIPTLQEALLVCKEKILVNIDKGYELFPACYRIARETQTLDQIVLKADKSYQEVKDKLGKSFEEVNFMPIVNLNKDGAASMLETHLANYKPFAIEFTLPSDQHPMVRQFKKFRDLGIHVWVNSLWAKQNGGHDDEKAVLDPLVYDWFLENHIDIIQTDRPKLLIDYLNSKK